MKPIFNLQDGYFGHLAKNHLWTQSECCAHACPFLARNRYDTFDAYLAGMAINIGMIVTVQILDQMHCGRETLRSIEFHKTVLPKAENCQSALPKIGDFLRTFWMRWLNRLLTISLMYPVLAAWLIQLIV